MKNNIDSNFAIAIVALVAACVGFAFWFSHDSFSNTLNNQDLKTITSQKSSENSQDEELETKSNAEISSITSIQEDLKKLFIKKSRYNQSNANLPENIQRRYSGDMGSQIIVQNNQIFSQLGSGDQVSLGFAFEQNRTEPEVIFAIDDQTKAIINIHTLSQDQGIGMEVDSTDSFLVDLANGTKQRIESFRGFSCGAVFNSFKEEVYSSGCGGEGPVRIGNVMARSILTDKEYIFMDLVKYGDDSMSSGQSDDAFLAVSIDNDRADPIIAIKEFNESPQREVILPREMQGELTEYFNRDQNEVLYSAKHQIIVIGDELDLLMIQLGDDYSYISHDVIS